ncbi:hypothetical protein [Actinoplanes sp. NPDC051859]|uniref:hypothetical protein n=1 Tax=Actinoplanes sp. NPDC051859 TaxID=3363909 RepID=UPI0037A6F303
MEEQADSGTPMPGWPWLTGGLLALVVGVLWTAQGLDLTHDSVLSDVFAMALIGPAVAAAGLAALVLGVRIRAHAKRTAHKGTST